MTTIKSLRIKQKEDATAVSTAQSRAEKAEKQLADLKSQLKKASEIEKKNTERLKVMYKIEAASEALKRERDSAVASIATLQEQLAEAVVRAEEAVNVKQTEALEQERQTTVQFREELEKAQMEAKLTEDRLNAELTELKGRLEKEQSSARNQKEELSAEINVLLSLLCLMVDSRIEIGDFEIACRRVIYFGQFISSGKDDETDRDAANSAYDC
jgi:TATA element modulatory factor